MEKTEKNWQSNNDNTSLVDTLYEYLRHWRWFIASVLVCLAAGVTVILVTQKQYKSSLSILLNEDKGSGKGSAAEFDLGALGLLSTTSNIENEVAILSSPDLMYSVADTLNLQTTYYINKEFKKTELYSNSPLFVTLESTHKKDMGNIEFYLQKTKTKYEVFGTYSDKDIHETIDSLPAEITLGDNVIIKIESTGKEIIDDEKYYISINDRSSTVSSLSANLSISPTSKTSSVLNIGLISNNSEKAAAILQELVKQYNEMNIKINNEIAYSTALFINDRLKEISIELGDVEGNVVDFKQKNQITDLSTEAQLFVQQTGQNEQKLMDVETQLNVISLIERFVNDPANKYAIIPNIGVSDVGLSQIISEYNNKLLNSDVQLKGMGNENPTYIRLTEDINNMRNSIISSLKNVKQTYNVSKQDLLKQASATKARISSVPQQERGLIEKVREQRIKENLFLFLMQKREETNLSIASTANKARIIVSPQEKLKPIAPKSQIIILSVLILGFLIPVVVIYVINIFKTQIKNRNELEKLSEVAIIGQIGQNKMKDQIVVQANKNSGEAEMFRSLRNNINFVLKHRVNQAIMVTSTIKGEGKTFVSVNLSMSFALSGKKVLLVGGDIRNPMIKNYITTKEKKGLSDYLASEKSWKKYVNNSELHPNLQVMIAGTIPPNPNELLMSPRLKEFLAEAKNEYDLVIVDSAPVGLVSDSYLIDEYIDLTLYVVRENVTPRDAVNFINTQKAEEKLMNMYLVLNDSSSDGNYKYGFGKEYGYGNK